MALRLSDWFWWRSFSPLCNSAGWSNGEGLLMRRTKGNFCYGRAARQMSEDRASIFDRHSRGRANSRTRAPRVHPNALPALQIISFLVAPGGHTGNIAERLDRKPRSQISISGNSRVTDHFQFLRRLCDARPADRSSASRRAAGSSGVPVRLQSKSRPLN